MTSGKCRLTTTEGEPVSAGELRTFVAVISTCVLFEIGHLADEDRHRGWQMVQAREGVRGGLVQAYPGYPWRGRGHHNPAASRSNLCRPTEAVETSEAATSNDPGDRPATPSSTSRKRTGSDSVSGARTTLPTQREP